MPADDRSPASPATDAAFAALDELIRCGLRDIVVCPGSRSQALALAAVELERRGRVTVHVRIDERVAGFFALGIGRESSRPAAIIVTSGTAVANLLPAVMEAHHAGVGMIVLSADRPPELRGIGANQATRQPGLFGTFVAFDVDLPTPTETDPLGEHSRAVRDMLRDAWDAATAAVPAPAHVNLPLREPLAGVQPPWLDSSTAVLEDDAEADGAGALYQGGGGVGDAPRPAPDAIHASGTRRTVVIAGADGGPDPGAIAVRLNAPLIAEVVSGARFGDHLTHGYRAVLSDPELGGRIERAIVFGHPTLSREVTRLLSDPGVEVLAVRRGGEALNLNGVTREIGRDEIAALEPAIDSDWSRRWRAASEMRRPVPALVVDGVPVGEEDDAGLRRELTREQLVEAVWDATGVDDILVFGSSRLVRVADAVLDGRSVRVHANRGLAGIDGTIATATGIAVASQRGGGTGVTRVILGDLALLHDVGAMLFPDDEREPRLQVIVGNDGGGTIFDGLEVARVASAEDMTRVQYTPHSARLEQLAAAYGWEYRRPTTRAALDRALARPRGGRELFEVPLPR